MSEPSDGVKEDNVSSAWATENSSLNTPLHMTEDDLSTFIMNSLIALLVSIYAFMQKWVKVNINIFNSDLKKYIYYYCYYIYIFRIMEVK